MSINVIGFAATKADVENRGLREPDSTRTAILGALMPNPIVGLVVGRALADKQLAAEAAAAPPVTVAPPAPIPPPEDQIQRLEELIAELTNKLAAIDERLKRLEEPTNPPG